jgi:hypothetical protein
MVTEMIKSVLVLVIFSVISSCGFIKSIWNASAPLPALVHLQSNPLPNFSDIFNPNDQISAFAMAQWQGIIRDLFRKIEGAHQNSLSFKEIRILVESGLVKFGPDPKNSADRIIAVLEFLGFKKQVTAEGAETLLHWLVQHRCEARAAYLSLTEVHTKASPLTAAEVFNTLDFFGSLLELEGSEPVTPNMLAGWASPWIPDHPPHLRSALRSGADLLISLTSSFCGDGVDPNFWNGKNTGKCIHQFVKTFKETAPALDFYFGIRSPFKDPETIRNATIALSSQAHSWFNEHPPLPVDRIIQFGKDLSLRTPSDPHDLFLWANDLDGSAQSDSISLNILTHLSEALTQTTESFLLGIATLPAPGPCALTDWTRCEFSGESKILGQFFDENIHPVPGEKSLGLFSKVLLYRNLAEGIIQDLKGAQPDLSQSNLAERMTTLIPEILDCGTYLRNILNQIQDLPIENGNLHDTLKSYQFSGLVELIRLASEVIPNRVSLPPSAGKSADLDGTGLTGILYTYDRIRSMNPNTLNTFEIPIRSEGQNQYVKRKSVMDSLPGLLEHDFPKIYNSCLDYGFSRTCEIIFDEILSDSIPGTDEIEVQDLDVIPLAGILFERIYRHCDLNQDGKLIANRFINEKKCIVDIGTRVAQGLMNAGFIKSEPKVRRLIALTQRFFGASWAAQAALTRGTLQGLRWYTVPGSRLTQRPASKGSVLSLIAEIMDPEKAAARDLTLERSFPFIRSGR